MKALFAGECKRDNIYRLVDPTSFLEADFEAAVVRAITCVYPDYFCGVFAGKFVLNGESRKSDLAMIHKSFSHWFIVEVELAGHSLEHHVLPQLRCFRYGDPDPSCVTSLVNGFPELSRDNAARILDSIPSDVVVVGNLVDPSWTAAVQAVPAQYLVVSLYTDSNGTYAYEVEGRLVATSENLGFATYSAIDDCLRIKASSGLPTGQVQILDQFGIPNTWTVRRVGDALWISKNHGATLLSHNSYVQLLRTRDNQLALKLAL